MKKVLAFLLIAMLTVTTACGTNLTKPKSESNKGGTNISRKQPTDVMNARTNFAFSLYPHVHEEGTEAAAVTSVEVGVTSLNTSEPQSDRGDTLHGNYI